MSADDLLRSPANARSLMEAVTPDRAGEAVATKTMAELDEPAGDG
jgi:antitoxin YefM